MFSMCMNFANMQSDASQCAPACQSACSKMNAVLPVIMDTAVAAVSFLHTLVRICLLALVRIMIPKVQS